MDILLELKQKDNIWVDIESKQLKAWYKGREYGVPVSTNFTDWESSKQNRNLIKSPYITQRDFKEAMGNEFDSLLGLIWINQ